VRQDLLLRSLRPEDEGALSALFVANDRPAVTRRRGIGRMMTSLILEDLRRRGEREVRARVHDDNEASLRMFEANGFREVERRDGRIILACRLADASGAVGVAAPRSRRAAR
jgi:ribosomal protein S18 acetylase RimI-like enzyme